MKAIRARTVSVAKPLPNLHVGGFPKIRVRGTLFGGSFFYKAYRNWGILGGVPLFREIMLLFMRAFAIQQ